MTVLITCHTNADFDAFAAMIAVRHFYTKPLLLFPGTQENRIKKYLEKIDTSAYGFVDQNQIAWESIDHVVIVDTRQPGRVPHLAPILNKPGLSLEIWDHHPKSTKDFQNARIHECRCGAVTSYLAKRLKTAKIPITKEEATILALGIYEDTGAFTYSSTRALDFYAAAWLAEKGMNIDEIAELEMHQFNERQIQLLNDLIESSQVFRVHGHDIIIADILLEESYDCAFLAYQLMEMGKHQVVFVLCQMGERIQIIARSKTPDVNVGTICSLLGGGGHTYAASASVRNVLLSTVRETILRQLHLQNDDKSVRAYMSTPPIGVQTTTLIREADEMMFHFGLKSVPVFHPGTHRLAGIFDVQTAQRAMNHELSEVPVEQYMRHHIQTVCPNAPMSDVAKIILTNNQRMVPVVEHDAVIGILTRTDLVNIFAEISSRDTPRGTKYYHIEKMLLQQLPRWILDLLDTAGAVGRSLNLPVYVVGGFLRDCLLQVPNHDIDLVVEENGERFAQHLAEALHGRVSRNEKFMTALVIYTNAEGVQQRIDVATARLEYYEHPAALPMVEVSPLKMDLARRDFTINTLALRLDKDSDHLIDFFGGQRDIKENVIRVLHTLSFVEDPTRCLRAVRFEQRYGFRLGKNTEKLIRNAVTLKVLDRVKQHRLLHEFVLICQEQDPVACFLRLENLGIIREILPKTIITKNRKRLLVRIRQYITWYQMLYLPEEATPWILYLFGLNYGLSYTDAKANMAQLHLEPQIQDAILARRTKTIFLCQKAEKWCTRQQEHPSMSELCNLFKDIAIDDVIYCMALNKDPKLSKHLSQYVTKWRSMRADIRGKDLKDQGIPPGPIYAKILEAVLSAKLDGRVTDKESQLALAKELAQTLERPVRLKNSAIHRKGNRDENQTLVPHRQI
ncbi:MAG: CBS domain-containing protein [Desulfovibrio sp.]|nr:CBS domain-containing protein [Desulfovibrio sp.]